MNRERFINILMDIMRIVSEPRKERKLADYVLDHLVSLHVDVYEDDAQGAVLGNTGNIIAHLPNPEAKKLLFYVALDGETFHNETFRYQDEKFSCQEVIPMNKIGIAILLEYLHMVIEEPRSHADLTFIFTVASSYDVLGMRAIAPSQLTKKDMALGFGMVGPFGNIVTSGPFVAGGLMTVYGQGQPIDDENLEEAHALSVASHALHRLKLGRIDDTTVCNIGVIQGGEKINYLMEKVQMNFDVRSLRNEKLSTLLYNIDYLFGTACDENKVHYKNELEIGFEGYHVLETDEVYCCLEKAYERLSVTCRPVKTLKITGANVLNAQGVPAVELMLPLACEDMQSVFYLKDADLMVRLLLEIQNV